MLHCATLIIFTAHTFQRTSKLEMRSSALIVTDSHSKWRRNVMTVDRNSVNIIRWVFFDCVWGNNYNFLHTFVSYFLLFSAIVAANNHSLRMIAAAASSRPFMPGPHYGWTKWQSNYAIFIFPFSTRACWEPAGRLQIYETTSDARITARKYMWSR